MTDQPELYRVQTTAGETCPAAPARLVCRAISVVYRNWRGEPADWTVVPLSLWFGSTEWHPEPQWFIKAFDQERCVERDFALDSFVDIEKGPKA